MEPQRTTGAIDTSPPTPAPTGPPRLSIGLIIYFTAWIAALLAGYSRVVGFRPADDVVSSDLTIIRWMFAGLVLAFLPLYLTNWFRSRLWRIQPGEFLLLASMVGAAGYFAFALESLWIRHNWVDEAYYAIEVWQGIASTVVLALGAGCWRQNSLWRLLLGVASVIAAGHTVEALLFLFDWVDLIPFGLAIMLAWLKLILWGAAPMIGMIVVVCDVLKGRRWNSWHWIGCFATGFVIARKVVTILVGLAF